MTSTRVRNRIAASSERDARQLLKFYQNDPSEILQAFMSDDEMKMESIILADMKGALSSEYPDEAALAGRILNSMEDDFSDYGINVFVLFEDLIDKRMQAIFR
jgi:hypothetical protein